MNDWKFNEPQNVAVITTVKILNGENEIIYVSHDLDDGMWQFLDGEICETKNAILIALKEMVEHDNSIVQIANLPTGYIAHRKSKKDVWVTEKLST